MKSLNSKGKFEQLLSRFPTYFLTCSTGFNQTCFKRTALLRLFLSFFTGSKLQVSISLTATRDVTFDYFKTLAQKVQFFVWNPKMKRVEKRRNGQLFLTASCFYIAVLRFAFSLQIDRMMALLRFVVILLSIAIITEQCCLSWEKLHFYVQNWDWPQFICKSRS